MTATVHAALTSLLANLESSASKIQVLLDHDEPSCSSPGDDEQLPVEVAAGRSLYPSPKGRIPKDDNGVPLSWNWVHGGWRRA
jgi:hypothetical protein